MKDKSTIYCFKNPCNKNNLKALDNLLVIPFQIPNLEIQNLLSFFLHLAPDIESVHARKINISKHNEILNRMFENRHYQYSKFCASNAKIENELSKAHLNGDLLCLKCKRFVCKKKGGQSETDLDCFLRHIRNAIAHGRVYYCHAGNRIHIIFEDMNNSGNISARIVCIKADLKYWKKILTEEHYYI